MAVYSGPAEYWYNSNEGRTSQSTRIVVQDGLVLNLDAGVSSSYPGSGSTWTDLSSLGNNGSLIQAPSYNSNNGGSLVFNGSSNYASLSSSLIGANGAFTYEIAVYRTGNGTNWPIFFINGAVNSSITIAQYNNTTGVLFRVTNGKGNFDEYNLPTGTLVNDQWVCLSFSMTVNRYMDAYINGVKYGNGGYSNGTSTPSTSTSSIGGDSSSSWDGRIAYARMYNRALTESEVEQNFNALRTRYGI
jgi:hypothetical protein